MHSSSVALPLENLSGGREEALNVAFDRYSRVSLEYIAAVIVLAEIVVLFSGVVSRYAFQKSSQISHFKALRDRFTNFFIFDPIAEILYHRRIHQNPKTSKVRKSPFADKIKIDLRTF